MSLAQASTDKTCDSCKKYLSVKPLHKYENGEIRCGRCALPNDGGVPVWFTDIPDNTLFRCINHYDGCKRLLNHWDVKAHEISCITISHITCPLCQEKKRYSPLLLLHHLKDDHQDSILNKPKLIITLSALEKKIDYIYYTEELISVIRVFLYAPDSIEVLIKPILTSGRDFRELSIQMEGYGKDPKSEVDVIPLTNQNGFETSRRFKVSYSDVKKCRSIKFKFSISVNTESFSLDYAVQENFGNMYSKLAKFNTFEQKMTLSGCRTVVMLPNGNVPTFCNFCKVLFYQKGIYKCENNEHFICSVCRYFDIEECKEGKRYVKATAEERLLNEQYFLCKWNCTHKDRFSFLDCHEILCANQPRRKCPVSSCDFHGTLQQIFRHYKNEHSWDNIKLYDYWQVADAVYILTNITNNKEWHYYVNTYDVFIKIRCQEIDADYIFTLDLCEKRDMNVKCCALVKCNGERGYKVENNFRVSKDKLGFAEDGKGQIFIKVFIEPTNM